MSDPYKKVQPGQKLRIPAEAYNAFIDTALDRRSRQQGQEQNATPQSRQTGIILVRNDSGQDRNRFDVLGISSIVISPADNLDAFKAKIALAGIKPTTAAHAGRFVVLLEPIAAGKIGQAAASGVTVARVNVINPDHRFADVADNQSGQLDSTDSGAAVILWKESGTGIKWAVLRLGAGGGKESIGVNQYTVHMMTAQNVDGWDYLQFAPTA